MSDNSDLVEEMWLLPEYFWTLDLREETWISFDS